VVRDGQVEVCGVASIGVGLVFLGLLVGRDVEGVSGVKSNLLVLRGVVDTIFSYKLKRTISVITLEDTDCTLRQWNTQFVGLFIDKLYLIACFDIFLFVTAGIDRDKVVFADSDVVDLGDELHLFFRVVVEVNQLAESVHVVI
jgi:hypothetical protein